MKTFVLAGLLLLAGLFSRLLAQGQGAATVCGSGRYSSDVFTAVTKTSGITYGQNSVRDYSQGTTTPITLQLDFYEPTGDVAAQRPLILFAFGGAFISGQRQDLDDLCQAFARKGYATATIDYRLVPPGPNNYNYALVFGSRDRLADQLVRASSDMKAAVRFFRAQASTYRIDPARIFVAGYSAGAVMALQTAYISSEAEDSNFTAAYQANGGLEGDTDLPAPNNLLPAYNARSLAGALSLAGAVVRLSIVDATDPPLYAAHGTNDTVLPYSSGPAFGISSYTVYGGGDLHARADSVGLLNQLYTIAGGDHGSTRQEPDRTAITTAAATFFQAIICPAPLPVQLLTFTAEVVGTRAYLRWQTASEIGTDRFEVEVSADGTSFEHIGTVAGQGNSTQAHGYTFTDANATRYASAFLYYRLRQVDQNGTAIYTPVRSVARLAAATGLALYPSPAAGHATTLTGAAPASAVLVFDALGRVVLTTTSDAAGSTQLTLPATLAPGVYLVRSGTQAARLLLQ